jgi:cytochrome P450
MPVVYDPRRPGTLADPWPVFHRLQAEVTPFARSRDPGDDHLAALLRLVGLWSVFTDPPTHTRLRGLMNLAFTSRAVERLRPQVTRIVGDLLAAMDARRGGDLIRDFAYPLPVLAFMRHPEQAEAVRVDGSLAVAAVDEGVRYDGPTQAMVRIASELGRHIAFGYGIHFCRGAPLAWLEGQLRAARSARAPATAGV